MGLHEILRLLWGTVVYRPYVYVFFACFLFFSFRHLRIRATAVYIVFSYALAYACEFSATRNGFPFGRYVYLDSTRTRELWISNIPFWDSLSFVFLSYFSWVVAAVCLDPVAPARALLKTRTAWLGGFLMMVLDIVIDPLTLLGDRWFLGKIYYYPDGGAYFGVTLSNFAGWWFVGAATLFVFQALARKRWLSVDAWGGLDRLAVWGAVGVYGGVLGFNLALTGWIGEWRLLGSSVLVSLLTLSSLAWAYLHPRARVAPGVVPWVDSGFTP